MKILVDEYYDGDTLKTLTETDGDKQDVKFIFPEEKQDGKQDGGIHIRFFSLKLMKIFKKFLKNF